MAVCYHQRGNTGRIARHTEGLDSLTVKTVPCGLYSLKLTLKLTLKFIGLDVVSCVLICPVTLGIVLCLVDFYFLLSILCVSLILSS